MASNSPVRVRTRGEGSLNYLRGVALHIAGHSNEEIAGILDCSTSTVRDMLNSPEGIALIAEAKRRVKDNVFGKIEAELVDLAVLSIDNIRDTVEANFTPGSRGKIHQDTIGLKLLGVLGYTEGAMGGNQQASLSVSDQLGERILKALEKADHAKELHGRDVTTVSKVEDVTGSD